MTGDKLSLTVTQEDYHKAVSLRAINKYSSIHHCMVAQAGKRQYNTTCTCGISTITIGNKEYSNSEELQTLIKQFDDRSLNPEILPVTVEITETYDYENPLWKSE